MSEMPGSPYAEQLRVFRESGGGFTSSALSMMALAYEQHTANLIAFYGDGGYSDEFIQLHQQIIARLGLNDD